MHDDNDNETEMRVNDTGIKMTTQKTYFVRESGKRMRDERVTKELGLLLSFHLN